MGGAVIKRVIVMDFPIYLLEWRMSEVAACRGNRLDMELLSIGGNEFICIDI